MLVRLALVAAAGVAPCWVAMGQSPAPAGPSFMVIRYSSQASLTFYGGYQVGRVLGFVGFVQNPRNSYREALVGVGTTMTLGRGSLLVGLAGADASDGWYGQLYLLPTLRTSRLELSGTIEVYQPLEAGGAYQFYTTPLNGFLVVNRDLAVGMTYLASAQAGIPDGHALGPSIRVGIPKGSLRFDLMRRVRLAPSEVRITVTTSF